MGLKREDFKRLIKFYKERPKDAIFWRQAENKTYLGNKIGINDVPYLGMLYTNIPAKNMKDLHKQMICIIESEFSQYELHPRSKYVDDIMPYIQLKDND